MLSNPKRNLHGNREKDRLCKSGWKHGVNTFFALLGNLYNNAMENKRLVSPKTPKKEPRVIYKKCILDYANESGEIKTCREFNVDRATFYAWKKDPMKQGEMGCIEK